MFLQGDPFIQSPGNLQNFNRYGYCYNNPLSCTDPSGHFFGIDDWIVYAFIATWVAEKAHIIDIRTARQITGLLVAVVLGPCPTCTPLFGGGITQAAVAGFASGVVSTGTLKGGLTSAFSAGVFAGVGNVIDGGNFFTGGVGGKLSTAAGIGLHAVAGCVTSVVGGGKCESGALSAAFSKALAPSVMEATEGNRLAGTLASAVIGGTGSVLGGGKFSNGAMTGAFSYLFNELLHSGPGAMQRAGYKETAYADGTYCNIQGSPSCGYPQGAGSREIWTLGYSESAKMSIRAGGYAGEYNIDSMEPTFAGLQVGGPSYKLTDTMSYGYTSGEYAPMVKANFSLGYLVGGDVGLSVGFNGIKVSLSLGGGTFGQVTGKFPRQQVVYGSGPSFAAGVGKQ